MLLRETANDALQFTGVDLSPRENAPLLRHSQSVPLLAAPTKTGEDGIDPPSKGVTSVSASLIVSGVKPFIRLNTSKSCCFAHIWIVMWKCWTRSCSVSPGTSKSVRLLRSAADARRDGTGTCPTLPHD